jgi:hypothetical protein
MTPLIASLLAYRRPVAGTSRAVAMLTGPDRTHEKPPLLHCGKLSFIYRLVR